MTTPPPLLSPAAVAARLALIGAIIGALAVSFAYVAGWLTQGRIDGAAIADALEAHDGRHAGFRRAHAKGLCISGRFVGNGNGAALSRAGVFAAGEVPVIGRLSTGGGHPFAPDGRLVFHAIALSFTQPDGAVWRTAMDHTPVFPVATPEAFVALQVATAPDRATGEPDPARVADFLSRHPETQAFMDRLRDDPLPSSFANGTYYGINAFRFTNADGRTRFVRWSLEPEAPFSALDKSALGALPPGFLFDDAVRRLRDGPMRWHLVLTVAAPGDPVDDATLEWPAGRQRVDAGTLVIERAALEEDGPCRDITFDPLILPDGIAPSDDPLLPARSAAYAASLVRRDGEPRTPSALAGDPAIREAIR